MKSRGSVEWSVGKLLAIVLAVILLVLIIVGLATGGLKPLIDKVGGMADGVQNTIYDVFGIGEDEDLSNRIFQRIELSNGEQLEGYLTISGSECKIDLDDRQGSFALSSNGELMRYDRVYVQFPDYNLIYWFNPVSSIWNVYEGPHSFIPLESDLSEGVDRRVGSGEFREDWEWIIIEDWIDSDWNSEEGGSLCLDVSNWGTIEDGNNNVLVWNCKSLMGELPRGESLTNQQWIYDEESGRLRSNLSENLCLDVKWPYSNDGDNVHAWHCKDLDEEPDNQLWDIEGSSIKSRVEGNFCLDVNRGIILPGVNVISYTCSGRRNQQWIYNESDGTIRVPYDDREKLRKVKDILEESCLRN